MDDNTTDPDGEAPIFTDFSTSTESVGIATYDSPDPGIAIEDGKVAIRGYDTESEETAYLSCSRCGECIVIVKSNRAVCGCSETPAEWTTDEL